MQKDLVFFKKEGEEGLMKGLQTISLEDQCEENGTTRPESPTYGHVLTEAEYYAKERNRYYQLETEAAVIGKYIHPDGSKGQGY